MNQFKSKREEKKFTQAIVAQLLGIDKSTVSKWETSESFPRAELIIKLAKLYNCSVDDLLNN